MNLNQLKIFYLAAKNRNLSAAAKELFITQPAVTKGIQRLQEHYEIRFVDFVGKKLVLTDAGEVRVAKSYALAFAVNPRGPDHLMTETYAEFGVTPEARQLIKKLCGDEKYANPLLTDKRAEIVRWHEDAYAATECLGLCVFTSTAAYAVNPENMAAMMSLALGVEITEEELMLAGRRVVTLERCFNVQEGARREHDVLPWRLMHEPVPDGPNAGFVVSPEELNMMLDQYYELHEWDKATACPTVETLKALGLEFCLQ